MEERVGAGRSGVLGLKVGKHNHTRSEDLFQHNSPCPCAFYYGVHMMSSVDLGRQLNQKRFSCL
jgi:hypothetical protein